MSELNLKQIVDKLNGEFQSDERKLVFWYDANAEFAEDIDSLELENAKVLKIEPNNQFQTKYFLECEDKTTNYLVYAPFAKPPLIENHLADTIRYSKEFFADRASLIVLDLGMSAGCKAVVQRYISFFANEERFQKFKELDIENYNETTITTGIMSVICKSKAASFEEVMRCILTDDDFDNNAYLAEFEKYNLTGDFWKQVEAAFGYNDSNPSLKKLIITMFVTYASKVIHEELPKAWEPFKSYKYGNIVTFLDNVMNSYIYKDRFDEISETVYNTLDAKTHLAKMDVESLIDCNIFAGADELIIGWILARLENEDVGAKLGEKTIYEICSDRRKKHFGAKFSNEYSIAENACYILSAGAYKPISDIRTIAKNYTGQAYKIDSKYRYFYYYLDKIEDSSRFEKLRDLVENVYTNEFLNKITANWTDEFELAQGDTGLLLQRDFFREYVSSAKERTVVIISDALRYEVAYSLFERLQSDEKCAASITAMQGVLPSYTPLGMAALLPHNTIEYNDSFDVLIDGKICASTEQRGAHLKSYKPNSKCIQFDELKNMKQAELRNVFTGQDVVYVYHNQVDARGDAAKTENEVFIACGEAIEEIHVLIRRLSSQANTHHFLITADHGFIYKRDKIKVCDKISGVSSKSNSVGQRYAISNEPIVEDGVSGISLGKVLGNQDSRTVSYPIASDIFKVAGAGQNYVHGGCSPQEMLIPVIDVKVERGKKETSNAQIELIALSNKITNLITAFDFVQTEPVSDIVKEAKYRLYFISDSNEKISNENICCADKKETDSTKRMFRFSFSFKNKKYDKSKKYYLVVYDYNNDVEVQRYEMIIDIAFADDFGFFN